MPLLRRRKPVISNHGALYVPAPGGGSTLKNDLVSFWEFEDSPGLLVDAHGSNTLTNNNGVVNAAGKVGEGMVAVNSTDSYLSCADNADLNTSGTDFSVAFWANGASGGKWVGKADSFANAEWSITLAFTTETVIRFQVGDAGGFGAETVDVIPSGGYSTGVWYFVVATVSESTGAMTLSVNAGTRGTNTKSATIKNGADPLTIGHVEGFAADVTIDQFGFWKKVLSEAEEDQLYSAGDGLAYSAM